MYKRLVEVLSHLDYLESKSASYVAEVSNADSDRVKIFGLYLDNPLLFEAIYGSQSLHVQYAHLHSKHVLGISRTESDEVAQAELEKLVATRHDARYIDDLISSLNLKKVLKPNTK